MIQMDSCVRSPPRSKIIEGDALLYIPPEVLYSTGVPKE